MSDGVEMQPYYDISMVIHPQMLSWNNSNAPTIKQTQLMSKGDACNESMIACNMHTGSHTDAPYHFLDHGEKLHECDIATYFGPCWVAELQGPTVTAAALEAANIPIIERLLLKTENVQLRKSDQFNPDFVALDPDAAEWILQRGIRCVGVDYLSVERYCNKTCPVHRTLLGAQVALIEGLVLDEVPPGRYLLVALPLRIQDVEAAPLRAILLRYEEVLSWVQPEAH